MGVPEFKALPDWSPGYSSANIIDHLIDDINDDISLIDRERRNSSGSRQHDLLAGKIDGLQFAKYKIQAMNSKEKLNETLNSTKFAHHYESFAERDSINPMVKKRQKVWPTYCSLGDMVVLGHYEYREKIIDDITITLPRSATVELERTLLRNVGLTCEMNEHVFRIRDMNDELYIEFSGDYTYFGKSIADFKED
jgi:hypothetical protein